MKFSRFIAIFATFFVCSALVQAESENKLAVNLATEAGYIDNFLYQARNEQSTAYYHLSSDLAFSTNSQQSAFNVDAKVISTLFDKFDSDNHSNFTVIPKYQFKFSQNQRFYISGRWRNHYIFRGTGLSLGEAESLLRGDEKTDVGAAIGYEYGTVESQGKLNFELNYRANEFTTRRPQTSRLDTEIVTLKSSFDYLLSGKTFLAVDLDYQETQYPNAPLNNRDSITSLVGIKWHTTVISELSFLVGFQQLQFEDSRLSDDEAFQWRFYYTWRPTDFTRLQLTSDRKFDDSFRFISSYRLAQTHQIDLEHAFTEQIKVYATIGLNNETFITTQSKQKEDYLFSTLALDYQYSDRLSVQLNYHYKSMQANIEDIDYLYNRFGLSIKVTL